MSLKKIKNSLFSLIGLVALLLAASGVVSTAAHACEVTISIDVSPNILNVQSNSTVLTVHTNIDYHLVNAPTVSIYLGADDPNPVAINWWKADDCGNFVAKFSMSDIKAQLGPDDYDKLLTFTMKGETTSGEEFCGEQDILVANNGPNSR
ncbi:MAG: hypothetical protein WBF13_05785 [Candidatus Zixiibacteriota bacterium]